LASLWIFITVIAAVVVSITKPAFIDAATSASRTRNRIRRARQKSYNAYWQVHDVRTFNLGIKMASLTAQ